MHSEPRPTGDDEFNDALEHAPHYLHVELMRIFALVAREPDRARWEAAGIVAQAEALERLGTSEDKAAAEGARLVANFIIERSRQPR